MAQVSYRNYNKTKPVYKVGFFPTLQDGEEILVRFPYSKGEDFHTVTTHTLKVNGIFRYISCPEDNCPLCAKEKAKETIFIKVLIYKVDGDKVVPSAVVWGRPKLFGKEIEDAFNAAFEYNIVAEGSALEDVVFKIKRTGTGTNTKYSVKPAKVMYQTSELYGKKFDDFKDLKLGGVFYLEKSSEDINWFLHNNSFPYKKSNTKVEQPIKQVETAPTTPVESPIKVEIDNEPVTEQPIPEQLIPEQLIPAQQVQTHQPLVEAKPRRKYNFGK